MFQYGHYLINADTNSQNLGLCLKVLDGVIGLEVAQIVSDLIPHVLPGGRGRHAVSARFSFIAE